MIFKIYSYFCNKLKNKKVVFSNINDNTTFLYSISNNNNKLYKIHQDLRNYKKLTPDQLNYIKSLSSEDKYNIILLQQHTLQTYIENLDYIDTIDKQTTM